MDGQRLLRSGALAATLAVGILITSPQSVAACLPIDPPADHSFRDGIALGFAGTVVEVRDDPELALPRVEVVIEVDTVIAGDVAPRVSLVRGNPYCDSLLYDVGDRVVVASGLPEPEGPFGLWSKEFGPGPPYNKYQVAVWGPFRPDGTTPVQMGPTIDGEDVPRDANTLINRLAALPDTAVRPAGLPVGAIGWALIAAALAVAGCFVVLGVRSGSDDRSHRNG